MALILFGVFIALLLIGVPVAFSICSAAAMTLYSMGEYVWQNRSVLGGAR